MPGIQIEPGEIQREEGWQKQFFQSSDALASAIVVDSAATVHVGYKEHGLDTTLKTVRITTTCVRLEPGQSPVSKVRKTGDGSEIAVDSLDRVHVTFSDGGKATCLTSRQ